MTPRQARIALCSFLALAAGVAINALFLQSRPTMASRAVLERPLPRSTADRLPSTRASPRDERALRTARLEPDSATLDAVPDAVEDETGETVRAVQRELRQRGYGTLVSDGVMRPVTRAAIMAYEHDQGLPLTGEASETLLKRIVEKAQAAYDAKLPGGAETSFRQYERYVMLQILDAHWREHLAALDHLRQGIHLRGYAQKNPKQEYKREAFELFGVMVEAVKLEVIKTLTAVEIRTQEDIKPDDQAHVENVRPQHASTVGVDEEAAAYDGNGDVALAEAATKKKAQPTVRHVQKVGRNDACPCGSGKKYKHCHGKLT